MCCLLSEITLGIEGDFFSLTAGRFVGPVPGEVWELIHNWSISIAVPSPKMKGILAFS